MPDTERLVPDESEKRVAEIFREATGFSPNPYTPNQVLSTVLLWEIRKARHEIGLHDA